MMKPRSIDVGLALVSLLAATTPWLATRALASDGEADEPASIFACPPPDLLEMYWTGTEVRVVRGGLSSDKNRVYAVAQAIDIPSARAPLVPVVEDLRTEAVVDTYGSGAELVFYEMVTVCGNPEEESGPD